ncbi:hypothetical protein FSP39_025047 [Pinctada imbricata]|uniref:Hexosyltransferase n=1 Tax=Pinctada imbricata TaxID=66713 RepID=A0AA88Y8W1_PINIB|nr:hypothetical protein FSP39_025047 [Pinctada imbricata]
MITKIRRLRRKFSKDYLILLVFCVAVIFVMGKDILSFYSSRKLLRLKRSNGLNHNREDSLITTDSITTMENTTTSVSTTTKSSTMSRTPSHGHPGVHPIPLEWCKDLRWKYPQVINVTVENINEKSFKNLTPIHSHPFDYIYNPYQTCNGNINILSVIKSSAGNVDLRYVIRNTFGNVAKSGPNRMIFLVGFSRNEDVQRKIKRESKFFDDVIQEDFIDNYYNNSLKTVMGIRWIAKFCQGAKFILFVDDDVMINFKRASEFFANVKPGEMSTLFSGNLKGNVKPIRKEKNFKWPMSLQEYPYDCYPPFLSGGTILTSGIVVKAMNQVIPYVKLFKFDDVYIAIIGQKLGIVPQSNNKVEMGKRTKRTIANLIAKHGFSRPRLYFRTYKNFLT